MKSARSILIHESEDCGFRKGNTCTHSDYKNYRCIEKWCLSRMSIEEREEYRPQTNGELKEANWFYCAHFDLFRWTSPLNPCLANKCPVDARNFNSDYKTFNDSTRSFEGDEITCCATDCPYITVYGTREKMQKARAVFSLHNQMKRKVKEKRVIDSKTETKQVRQDGAPTNPLRLRERIRSYLRRYLGKDRTP